MKMILKKISRILSDSMYLKIKYFIIFKKKLNIKNPKTFNEKLQWLKLNNRKDIYTMMVDKYEVKQYVANIIGEEYIIPTLGIYDKFEDIDFSKLPNQFVIKCTHDSGGVVICKDKNKLDIKQAKNKICKSMKNNYYYAGREWPYKNIKPRIIIEKYLEDQEGELKDYKFFSFNGNVKALYIATDRNASTDTCFDFYDKDFKHLEFTNGYSNSSKEIHKPVGYDKMIELAEKIGKDIIHCRVDFYNINGKIYFGEITFYHWSGLVPFVPEEWDYIFGEWLELPNENI